MVNEKVSVIMPVYNGERWLAESIESVMAQTYPDWELIVIDDGSRDASAGIASRCAEKDPRISLVSQENGGSSKARNAGIRQASGRYICLLDSDDTWHPDFLEKQLRLLRDTGAALACSSYDCIGPFGEKRGSIETLRKISLRDMRAVNHIGCLTGIYDTSFAGKIYLREELGSLRDDYAWFVDILRATGREAVGNPLVLASYRLNPHGITNSKIRMVRPQYHFYRTVMHAGPIDALWRVAVWGVAGLMKYRRLRREIRSAETP